MLKAVPLGFQFFGHPDFFRSDGVWGVRISRTWGRILLGLRACRLGFKGLGFGPRDRVMESCALEARERVLVQKGLGGPYKLDD